MKKSYIVIVTVIVLSVIVGVVGLVVRNRINTLAKPAIVRLEQIQRGDLTEFVSAPGAIEPKTKVELSAKVSARIVELPFEEGDRVTGGNPNADPPVPASVLVRLDSKDLESQLQSARASYSAQAAQIEVEKARLASQKATLAGLQATLMQAQRDFERQQGLLESQDISQSTFDQTRLKLDELKSQYESSKFSLEAADLGLVVLRHNLEVAEAKITQAGEALSYTTITSPIDGVVTRINAEVGEVVIFGTMNNPGTVIMEVSDLSKMLVVAEVDEADVGKLAVGQSAIVHVDAYTNHEFKGGVDAIALAHTVSRTNTRYFRTEILLKDVDKKLYEGLSAHVDIETRKHTDRLKVPTQAVMGRDIDSLPLAIRDKSPLIDKTKTFATVVYCYADGRAIATPVKIGQSDLTHTIIEQGLKQGDKVIIGPYKILESIKHDQLVQDERDAAKNKTTADTGKGSQPSEPNDSNQS